MDVAAVLFGYSEREAEIAEGLFVLVDANHNTGMNSITKPKQTPRTGEVEEPKKR